MAKQAIGVGTSANDGTGDDLRSGAQKINANFDEIYTALGSGTALSSGISASATAVTLTSPTISGVIGGTTTSQTITALTTEGISNANGELEITAANQVVEIQGGGSNSGAITLNCENNSHGQKIIAASHSALQSNSGNPATLTLPSTGIASQELVSTDATQTLVNKSLTSPTITGTGTIAGTFTGDITGNVTGNVTGNIDGIVGGTTPAAVTGTTITSTTTFQLKAYADTTARDSAIASPVAGMLVYLTATNKAQVYNGTAWEDLT
jgi:hypothetical protein